LLLALAAGADATTVEIRRIISSTREAATFGTRTEAATP
jgi:hypothetical protein